MQHRGFAIIQCCEAAVDGGGKLVGFGDVFAMSAEGAPHRGLLHAPLLSLLKFLQML